VATALNKCRGVSLPVKPGDIGTPDDVPTMIVDRGDGDQSDAESGDEKDVRELDGTGDAG
jgi:hypothetical protein